MELIISAKNVKNSAYHVLILIIVILVQFQNHKEMFSIIVNALRDFLIMELMISAKNVKNNVYHVLILIIVILVWFQNQKEIFSIIVNVLKDILIIQQMISVISANINAKSVKIQQEIVQFVVILIDQEEIIVSVEMGGMIKEFRNA